MALHLVRFSYTPEAWSALVANPHDRRELLSARLFGIGGRLDGFWYSTGAQDGYVLVDFPDRVAVATVLVAIKSTGSFSSLEAIPLLTMDEMIDALQQANEFAYASPSA